MHEIFIPSPKHQVCRLRSVRHHFLVGSRAEDVKFEVLSLLWFVVLFRWRRGGGGGGGGFGCSSTPFMSEAVDLGYRTVHQVCILPDDSADSEHPVYLLILMYYWREGES